MFTLWIVRGNERISVRESEIIPRVGEHVSCERTVYKVTNILYCEDEKVYVFVKKPLKKIPTWIVIGTGTAGPDHVFYPD